MGDRGRKSALDKIECSTALEKIERPLAPAELTDSQREIWLDVVNTHEAGAFQPDIQPLLAAYCRHVIELQHIAGLIEGLKGDKEAVLKDYDCLLKMQERESRAASSLAVRLGIANSTYASKKAQQGSGRKIGGPRPWEYEGPA